MGWSGQKLKFLPPLAFHPLPIPPPCRGRGSLSNAVFALFLALLAACVHPESPDVSDASITDVANPDAISAQSLNVTPPSLTLLPGESQPLAALVAWSDGWERPAFATIWTSQAPSIATVDSDGLVQALAPGQTEVTAQAMGLQAQAVITVQADLAVVGLTLTPATITLTAPGEPQPLIATGQAPDGSPLPGLGVSWSSDDPQVAQVDPTGLVQAGPLNGSTRIRASRDSLEAYTNIETRLPQGIASIAEIIDLQLGTGGGYGQEYLPQSIEGPPSGQGGDSPQTSPQELLSLGHGGSITVMLGSVILDGEGPDLVIFENVFLYGGLSSNRFTEAAFVSVSQDGETYIPFPADYSPQGPGPFDDGSGDPYRNPANYEGLAGMEPVYAASDPADPASGGDRFDLADLGLSWALYLKIQDTGSAERAPGSESYDGDGDAIDDMGNHFPLSLDQEGFDLDAVWAIHPGHVTPW